MEPQSGKKAPPADTVIVFCLMGKQLTAISVVLFSSEIKLKKHIILQQTY